MEGRNTTQSGAAVESPTYYEAQVEQLRYDREGIITDVRNRMDDDPRMAQSNQEIGQDVFGGGLGVTLAGAEGTPDAVVERAQDVVDALFRDCDINGLGPGLVRGLLEDGELYLQPVVRDQRITKVRPFPTLTMEPLLNTAGEFADVSRSFRQIDLLSRETVALFPLWQVNWIRHDWRPTRGTANGRSQYLQVRGLGRALNNTENDLVIRRRTRSALKFHHRVGAPGTNDMNAVKAYKVENGLDQPGAAKKIVTDYYSTGDVQITALQGDANLGEIDDVKHLQDAYMGRLGKPKGLMGGWGDDINRDVLEQQQEQYQEFLNGLRNLVWNGDGGVYSGLKAVCDFALSLAGINPAMITYQPSWPRKLTAAQIKQIEAISKLRVAGEISHRTSLSLIGSMLGIESAEAELTRIEEERTARQLGEDDDDRAFAARQTGSPNRQPEDLDDDDEGAGVRQRRRPGANTKQKRQEVS